MTLEQSIKTHPMRPFQIFVIALCIAVAMIDGYEVLAMAFVAPYLSHAWGIGPVQIGYLLSAGVFGMALGAVVISPLADWFGRRRHMIMCMSFIVVGMILSALAGNVPQLIAARAFAGIFIGALISSLNIMVSEYSSDSRRGTAMGIYGIGLPAGVMVGGLTAGPLISAFGWRSAFLFGAAMTALALVVVLAFLPESIEYLVKKRPKNALALYNNVASRLGYAPADQLPAPELTADQAPAPATHVTPQLLIRSAFLWIGYACLMVAFYFSNTWTPKLIADATGNARLGGLAEVLIAFGGIVGALLFAGLSLKIRTRFATALIMVFGIVVYTLYADYFHNVDLALFLGVLVGATTNGGLAAFYAISPTIYPATIRGTGVGLMIGFGRSVGILAPIVAGQLLHVGWLPQEIYKLCGILLLVPALAAILLEATYWRSAKSAKLSIIAE